MRVLVILIGVFYTCSLLGQPHYTERQLRKFQRDRDKLIGLGKKYFARRLWDPAIEVGYRIIELDSSKTYGYFFLSDCYVGKGDFVRALNVLTHYDQKFPNDAYALFRIGQLWVSLNRSEEALPYYDRSIELQPNNAVVHFARSLILYKMERKDESLLSLNRGMELSVFNSPYIIWFKGVLLYEKNDYDGALQLFQSLSQHQELTFGPSMNFYIGMCYYKAGTHPVRARRYLTKAKKQGMPIDDDVMQDLATSKSRKKVQM